MTGIVVVSHSHALATAAVRLAEEMVPDQRVRIEVAAGLDEQTLGTDATSIVTAIEAADDGTGVVVLMDLGSAVLSAELAVELLDPELTARVVLSPGPLVEGLVVAAVVAAGGADPATVAAEAGRGLAAKQSQLGLDLDGPAAVSAAAPSAQSQARERAEFTIEDPTGLHARPAARLVQVASGTDGVEVALHNLSNDAGPVVADSMLSVMTLGAEQGHRIEVTATGAKAAQVVADIVDLARRNFDE